MNNTTITRTLHVTKPGHRCTHPYSPDLRKMLLNGEAAAIGGKYWRMEYYPSIKAYGVHPKSKAQPFYEFTNFNCAAAKHHELEKAHPSNSFESMMNN